MEPGGGGALQVQKGCTELGSGFRAGRDPFLGAVRMGVLTAHQGVCWPLEGCKGGTEGCQENRSLCKQIVKVAMVVLF